MQLIKAAQMMMVGPTITAPFNLQVATPHGNTTFDGKYVVPEKQAPGVYWAMLKEQGPPTYSYHLEGDSLVYVDSDSNQAYASSQIYDFSHEIPVLSFRTETSLSPEKGHDDHYEFDHDSLLTWRNAGEWWVCNVDVPGDAWSRDNHTAPGIAMWKAEPMIYPPLPIRKGCTRTSLRLTYSRQ